MLRKKLSWYFFFLAVVCVEGARAQSPPSVAGFTPAGAGTNALTVGASECASSTPCNARFANNPTVYSFTVSATINANASTPTGKTVIVFLTSGGALNVVDNAGTCGGGNCITCMNTNMGCMESQLSTPVFPANSIPIASVTTGSGTFATVNDVRATLSTFALVAGGGITLSPSNGTTTVAVDSTAIPSVGSPTPASGDCVKWVSGTQIGDQGAPCGAFKAYTPQTTAVTVSNSTTETALQSISIAAGDLNVVGKVVTVDSFGLVSTAASGQGNYTVKFRLDSATGTVLASTSALGLAGGRSNAGWHAQLQCATVTIGMTGAAECHMAGLTPGGSNIASVVFSDSNTATISMGDLTASHTIVTTWTFSVANASNAASQRLMTGSLQN